MKETDTIPADGADDPIDPQRDYESLWIRLLWMVGISILLSMAQTLVGLMTVVQFVFMLINKREPNETLAEFGDKLGVWMAKAVRYLTAASEVKPWPWTEFD